MPLARHVGKSTVIALEDGAGTFFTSRHEAFPDATDELWARADALDPGAVTADGEWLLRFRCFAVRLDSGETVLVDAGIGPADAPAAAWAPVPGRLPDELAAADIAPADVSAVVMTHLHTDHVGWAVTDKRPYFANARYVLQRADFDAVDTLNPTLREKLLDSLRHAGQLHLIDSSERLGPGLSTVATPGHTPGHQCALLESGGETLVLTGDLLVHAIQLIEPSLGYSHESDQAMAAQSRREIFRRVGDGVLATAHLSEPWVTFVVESGVPGISVV